MKSNEIKNRIVELKELIKNVSKMEDRKITLEHYHLTYGGYFFWSERDKMDSYQDAHRYGYHEYLNKPDGWTYEWSGSAWDEAESRPATREEAEKAVVEAIRRQIKAAEAELEKRREKGRRINETLGKYARGYWAMQWKWELSPEKFVALCQKAESDPTTIALALNAHAMWAFKKLLPQEMIRDSFPRTEDLIQGIAYALNISPSSEADYQKAIHGGRDSVVDVPAIQPGKWVFA